MLNLARDVLCMAAAAGAYSHSGLRTTHVHAQDNAAASILANPALANNPVVDRQLFLGFQADEPHKRHLKEVRPLCSRRHTPALMSRIEQKNQ